MYKELAYLVTQQDLSDTGGNVLRILKEKVHAGKREISHAKFIQSGITADGSPVRVTDRLQVGQILRILLEDRTEPDRVEPSQPRADQPLSVLYEDHDMIAVNKPAGVPVHPSRGHFRDNMASYVLWYLRRKNEKADVKVVGRLDRDTSGVLVFAKSRAAAARLSQQREQRIFQRTYLALVQGVFRGEKREGRIDLPLEPDPDSLMRQRVALSGQGKEAVTFYRVLAETVREHESELEKELSVPEEKNGYSLVEAHILTGRTHQIRVHMAYTGHPLLGDFLYGWAGTECSRGDHPVGEFRQSESLSDVPPDHLETTVNCAAGKIPSESLSDVPPDHLETTVNRAAGKIPSDSLSDVPPEHLGTDLRRGPEDAERAMLHACWVCLQQPFTGEEICLNAPIPDDFKRLIFKRSALGGTEAFNASNEDDV